jgi:hypothetical protein
VPHRFGHHTRIDKAEGDNVVVLDPTPFQPSTLAPKENKGRRECRRISRWECQAWQHALHHPREYALDAASPGRGDGLEPCADGFAGRLDGVQSDLPGAIVGNLEHADGNLVA